MVKLSQIVGTYNPAEINEKIAALEQQHQQTKQAFEKAQREIDRRFQNQLNEISDELSVYSKAGRLAELYGMSEGLTKRIEAAESAGLTFDGFDFCFPDRELWIYKPENNATATEQ
nr:hypothetical protein [uncultured Arsenicibacter sp.]